MHHLNINWKGYPHRRLPRIRVAPSRRTSVRSRSIARPATKDSIRRTLGPELERQKKTQRFALRRRRARKSRSSSAATQTRKLASLKARQQIQVFGWDPEVASKVDTLRSSSQLPVFRGKADIRRPESPHDTATGTTIIDSHDGAGASICRPKPSRHENLYSLMHVAEVPVYWSKKDTLNRKKPSIASSRALRRIGEYAHVGPLDSVSRSRTYRTPRKVGRSRTYDSRIDPRALLDRDRPSKSAPINPSSATRCTASRFYPSKGVQGSPELRRALESMVAKSDKDPQSVTPSMKSIIQTLLSDSASRTASQRKALKQFTKELELYLQAAKSLPKQTLVPSPSATTVSAHTIEELKPYKTQFQSAGLAVTSADQRGESAAMARLTKASAPPPTPPKDDRYSRQSMTRQSRMSGEKEQRATHQTHHHHKTESIPSFDTETTVMDFTPPHEQTSPRPARAKRHSSSEHTIMAFTPPHQAHPPQPKSAPPRPPRASTKKSLPWLRQPETADASPSRTPTNRGIVTASTIKAETRNPSDVLLSFSVPRASVERTGAPGDQVTRREPGSPIVEIKRKNTSFRDEVNGNNIKRKRKIYNDAAIQAAPELAYEYSTTDQGVKYVDAIVQTDFVDSGSPPAKDKSSERDSTIEFRPPLIATRSKTFPTTAPKCIGNCNQPSPPRIASAQSSKRYRDHVVQSDLIETPRDLEHPVSNETKRPLVKPSPKTPDRNGTYPFASPSSFRGSPARRNPNKSVDEVETRRSAAREGSDKVLGLTKEASPSPTRGSPSLLRCAKCGAEIDPCSFNQQPEAVFDLEFDTQQEFVSGRKSALETHPYLKARWSHTCTARSSLDCQQCTPRDVPVPASRREEPPVLAIRSPQQTYRHLPIREGSSQPAANLPPDWAATLESDLEEIIQSYHSPEERFMQYKVIADTVAEYTKPVPVADPVKKSSAPKLRLRALPKESRPNPAAAPPSFLDNDLAPSETATSYSSMAQDSSRVSDRAVFRGLHVATAAACDEDVAKWIEEITGTGIRKLLADLSAFEGLGFNTLAGVARRAAKQRRGEVRAWEKLRETRLQEKDLDEGWEDCIAEDKQASCEECIECAMKDEQQGRAKDRKMGFIAGDETVNLRAEKPTREKSAEEIVDALVKAKEGRNRENLRERAVRLGWRDMSVSGEV